MEEKEPDRKGTGRGTRKARNLENVGGYCSLHLEVRGCFKEGRFKMRIIIFSASVSNLHWRIRLKSSYISREHLILIIYYIIITLFINYYLFQCAYLSITLKKLFEKIFITHRDLLNFLSAL